MTILISTLRHVFAKMKAKSPCQDQISLIFLVKVKKNIGCYLNDLNSEKILALGCITLSLHKGLVKRYLYRIKYQVIHLLTKCNKEDDKRSIESFESIYPEAPSIVQCFMSTDVVKSRVGRKQS